VGDDVSRAQPSVVVLAGPNGAGKSTAAADLLQDTFGVREFVNADVIARGLSAFNVESVAIPAGRVMLTRLHELARQQVSFAFETTLASRGFAPWLADLKSRGYLVHIFFLWLPSAELAIERVADRVRAGGHDIPAETVRRRYRTGLRNFFKLYQGLASSWRVYDNSGLVPHLIAERLGEADTQVHDQATWFLIERGSRDES